MLVSRPWLILSVALVISGLLILWPFHAPPLTADESWTKWYATMRWPDVLPNVARYEAHPPLHYALIKLWSAAFGLSADALRAPSVIMGLALVPVCAWMARTTAASSIGVGLLTAISPVMIGAAREARPYVLMMLAFALMLGFALRVAQAAVEPGTAYAQRARWRDWTGYALSTELLMWSHGLGVVFAASIGLALLISLPLRDWRRYAGVHALIGLAWLPCLRLLMTQQAHRGQGWIVMQWARWPDTLASGLIGAAIPMLALLSVGIAVLGLAALQRRQAILLGCALFLPPLLESLLSALVSPVFIPRYLVPCALPLIAALVTSLAHPRYARVATFGVALFAGISLVLAVRTAAAPPEERWDVIDTRLAQQVKRQEEVWTLPNDLAMSMRDNGATPYPLVPLPTSFPAPAAPGRIFPTGNNATPAITRTEIRAAIAAARARGRTGVWIVTSSLPLFDPDHALPSELARVAVEDRPTWVALPVKLSHWTFRPSSRHIDGPTR